MGNIQLGLNLEFARYENGSFDWAMDRAAEIGYRYVEPMVHWGRELLSEAGYFHSRSMLDDPLNLKYAAESRGLQISSISAHAPLAKPDIAVDYLKQAVRYAAECGSPMIMVDDGPMPAWTTEEENFTLMKYTLREAVQVAEPRGIAIAIETHGPHTATPEGLDRLMKLVESPVLTINLDTGNSFLSGNDPHAWLETIIPNVTHMHAKDISAQDARKYRGKVRGMLGCACGDGIIDWERIIRTVAGADHDVVLSVECASLEAAVKSHSYLGGLISKMHPNR
ncbi:MULTISPECIES: sugar phosphate isomerase/epimerase [Arthrobacter]|uniref:Sugar phosphate isomerase/epimerase n=1 Tax=Arthrobacter terricola TaxID=2547396 RepID=A0A4R5K848_9MICC|nr:MULTISPECIES: sugar phosphate isomerase/epimerase family protein [Arthrobacter]MBT8163137.1 sugar phosphate isomerase/epimerase [Arthrobacter sp. GN70]TDF91291.1 sugar phosphate isomerase/epimerase [Arthrobacter terricola]